jgi:hypothetical protein
MTTMNTHPTPTRSTSRRALAGLFAAGAVAISLLAASPALADEATSSQSCWTDVDTGATGCFDSSLNPQDQIELATGKTVVAAPTGTETAARSAAVATDTLFMLVTGYDGTGRVGESNTYFTSNTSGCNAGLVFGFTGLGTWDNRFESIQSFNGCLTTLYTDTNFNGSFTNLLAFSDDLGTFKNVASSLDVE